MSYQDTALGNTGGVVRDAAGRLLAAPLSFYWRKSESMQAHLFIINMVA